MTGAFFCLLEVLRSCSLSVLLPWLLWFWDGDASTFDRSCFEKSPTVISRFGLWLVVVLMLTLVFVSFHSRAILGSGLLLSLTSLLIWEAICLASHSFPGLFKCRPCLVKYFLLETISISVTWLNSVASLLSLALYAWTSRLVLESLGNIYNYYIGVIVFQHKVGHHY